jgi:hypothetical protein
MELAQVIVRRLILLKQEEDAIRAKIDSIWKEEMLPHYNDCETMEDFQRVNADFQLTDPSGGVVDMPGNISLYKAYVIDRIQYGQDVLK